MKLKSKYVISLAVIITIVIGLVVAFNMIKKRPNEDVQNTDIFNITKAQEIIKKEKMLERIRHLEIESNLMSQDIPVFMYHSVSDDLSYIEFPINAVSVNNFKAQLEAIKASNCDTIFVSQLDKAHEYSKPIVLTFDDGFEDFYTNIYPMLKEYNMKATLFVIVGYINGKYYCTSEQLKEMQQSGYVQVESHTQTHKMLDTLKTDALIEEVVGSKENLQKITGTQSKALCYPVGKYNNQVLKLTQDNYSYGIAMTEGLYNTKKQGKYQIPRFSVTRYTNISTFKENINKSKKYFKY